MFRRNILPPSSHLSMYGEESVGIQRQVARKVFRQKLRQSSTFPLPLVNLSELLFFLPPAY
jgi:hypothetical protein